MRDHLSLGCTPAGEDCASVGRDDYYPRMRRETAAYMRQLRRLFGEPPAGCSLSVKGFPHDFGTYHEVVVNFDDNDEAAVEFAYKLESEMPESWDDEAKRELATPLPIAA